MATPCNKGRIDLKGEKNDPHGYENFPRGFSDVAICDWFVGLIQYTVSEEPHDINVTIVHPTLTISVGLPIIHIFVRCSIIPLNFTITFQILISNLEAQDKKKTELEGSNSAIEKWSINHALDEFKPQINNYV